LEDYHAAILGGDVPPKNIPGLMWQQLSTQKLVEVFPIVKKLYIESDSDIAPNLNVKIEPAGSPASFGSSLSSRNGPGRANAEAV
jgi:hypothetical protein